MPKHISVSKRSAICIFLSSMLELEKKYIIELYGNLKHSVEVETN